MFFPKFGSLSLVLALTIGFASMASARTVKNDRQQLNLDNVEPLNIAILIQDDLISQVSNELGVTKDFIRSLPKGSRVMIGYITAGSLQVRQQFTTDREKAARALRIPTSSTASSPYNPYVEVLEALKKFKKNWSNANAILLISDGLDTSRGLDATAAGHTLDIDRAINEANRRRVNVFAFFAPSVGLTSYSSLASSYGQSSLNRICDETGGKAFFQGIRGFVTFDSYFARLREALNEQYAKAR